MKKTIKLLALASMAIALAACGGNTSSQATSSAAPASSVPASSQKASSSEAPASSSEKASSAEVSSEKESEKESSEEKKSSTAPAHTYDLTDLFDAIGDNNCVVSYSDVESYYTLDYETHYIGANAYVLNETLTSSYYGNMAEAYGYVYAEDLGIFTVYFDDNDEFYVDSIATVDAGEDLTSYFYYPSLFCDTIDDWEEDDDNVWTCESDDAKMVAMGLSMYSSYASSYYSYIDDVIVTIDPTNETAEFELESSDGTYGTYFDGLTFTISDIGNAAYGNLDEDFEMPDTMDAWQETLQGYMDTVNGDVLPFVDGLYYGAYEYDSSSAAWSYADYLPGDDAADDLRDALTNDGYAVDDSDSYNDAVSYSLSKEVSGQTFDTAYIDIVYYPASYFTGSSYASYYPNGYLYIQGYNSESILGADGLEDVNDLLAKCFVDEDGNTLLPEFDFDTDPTDIATENTTTSNNDYVYQYYGYSDYYTLYLTTTITWDDATTARSEIEGWVADLVADDFEYYQSVSTWTSGSSYAYLYLQKEVTDSSSYYGYYELYIDIYDTLDGSIEVDIYYSL